MPKLSSEEDRKTVETAGRGGGGTYIKLEEGHNFVVLLDEDFKHSFVHWVHVGDKTYRRVCKAELDGKGWAPDECEICALAAQQYELMKEAKAEGDKALAEEYKTRGNRLRANYSSVFRAVKMKSVMERKKNKQGKVVKRFIPDFDEEPVVGKLQLTLPQTNRLFSLLKDDEETGELPYDFISVGGDLENRVLDFLKQREGDKKYAELKKIIPSKDSLELDIGEDELPDIESEFIFIDDLDEVVSLYSGEAECAEEDDYEEQEIEKKTSKGKTTRKKSTEDDL